MNIGLGIGIPFNRSQIWLSLFNPSSLFAAGEQGVWYDPSDLSTLFQDAAGTTPVTAVEQPVGLMLDKSKGLVLGSELVTNGAFDTDTWWLKGPNCAISGGAGIASAAASGSGWYKTGVLTVNAYYEITFTVVSCSAGAFRVGFMSTKYSAAYSTPGTYTTRLAADSTSFIVETVGTTTGSIDNVSVKQVTGNHAYQTVSTKRPVLSARVNLLTKTEQLADAAWGKGDNVVVTQNTAEVFAPDGTTTATKLNSPSTTGATFVRQLFNVSLVNHTGSVWVRKGNYRYFGLRVVNNDNLPSDYVVFDFDANSGNGDIVFVPATENVSYSFNKKGDWFEFKVTNLPNAVPRYFQIGITDTVGIEAPIVQINSYVYVWHPDLRVTNTGVNLPPYQRVNTAIDYDTQGFPTYLKFDGIDDSMQTNSIDFTATDKMQVFAGVRKLSDAAVGMVAELSADWNTNNGAFTLQAPPSAGSERHFFGTKGTVQSSATVASGYPAPITNVLTGIGNISGDQAILRVNGAQFAISTTDQGIGNYGNYPLYVGARAGTSLFFNGNLYQLIIAGGSVINIAEEDLDLVLNEAGDSITAETTVPIGTSTIEACERFVNRKTLAY